MHSECILVSFITCVIACGLIMIKLVCMQVPFTGGSVNTARSFGPAVVNNVWSSHWVSLGAIGPILLIRPQLEKSDF